jgi:hypothetical protein
MSLPFRRIIIERKGIGPRPVHGAKSSCFVGTILAASTVDCGFHPLTGAIPTPPSIERLFSRRHGRSDLFAQAISAL